MYPRDRFIEFGALSSIVPILALACSAKPPRVWVPAPVDLARLRLVRRLASGTSQDFHPFGG